MYKGIDVSLWQKNIEWDKVKADGISFAFIKSSQGGSVSISGVNPFTDPYFAQNIVNASDSGIKCGVYHYMTGTSYDDVVIEANYLIGLLEPYRDRIAYPVAIDIEHNRYYGLGKTYNAELVRVFADIIINAGYVPILYSFKSFLTSYVDLSMLSDLDVWLALWYNDRSCDNPPTFNNMAVWQYTDSGRVDGINSWVDTNISYKDYTPAKGDINADGIVNSKDYLIAKRAALDTVTLTDTERAVADINNDGKLDAKDYLIIKRTAQGTIK